MVLSAFIDPLSFSDTLVPGMQSIRTGAESVW